MHSRNSLDLLRLVAAALVLYSHQHVLLGLDEPTFFGWTTVGGLGVSVFFFLSGFLVWSSWVRDPDLYRFFLRRALRIFPGLWLLVVLTIFVLGPLLSDVSLSAYFGDTQTWRYLSNAWLLTRYTLTGVFTDNPYPAIVNGSLWTLPIEFFCYATLAVVGIWLRRFARWSVLWMLLAMSVAVAAAWLGPLQWGVRLTTHFEMVACFWWGVGYAAWTLIKDDAQKRKLFLWMALLLVTTVGLGSRGVERTAVLLCAASLVVMALHTNVGARLTDKLGDLSYGMYIFAFPVQQLLVFWGRNQEWSLELHLFLSLFLTSALAYISWHGLEKQALRLKPS